MTPLTDAKPDRPALTPTERQRLVLVHLAERQARWARPLGAAGMVLVLILVSIIGVVAWYIVPPMLADGETVDGVRFAGGPGARLMILAILALVATVGLIAILAGAIQLATGKRYGPIVRVMLWVAGLLWAAAIAVRFLP